MKHLIFTLFLTIACLQPVNAQAIEDTIIANYLEKVGFEKVNQLSSFILYRTGSYMGTTTSIFYQTRKSETESVFFFKDNNGAPLLRSEVRGVPINSKSRLFVYLIADESYISYIFEKGKIVFIHPRKRKKRDYLTYGYGSCSFEVCKGVYQAFQSKSLSFQGTVKFSESDCYKFKIDREGWDLHLFFDKNTYLLSGIQYQNIEHDLIIGKTRKRKRTYEDYVEFDGVLAPTKVTTYLNGKFLTDSTCEKIKFNVNLDDDLFYDALEKSEYSF